VEEAVDRVREAAGEARYNLYVVDRDQLLVGVVNLRELLMAEPGAPLSSLMKTAVHRLSARADRPTVVSHPGWRLVHALPVVDERGRYLGAVRYRTMRRLEEGLRNDGTEEGATARALGGLLRAGASAVLEALVSSVPSDERPYERGRAQDDV
jgi:magnesium transporter